MAEPNLEQPKFDDEKNDIELGNVNDAETLQEALKHPKSPGATTKPEYMLRKAVSHPQLSVEAESSIPHWLQWPLFFWPYNVDNYVARWIGGFAWALETIAIFGLIFTDEGDSFLWIFGIQLFLSCDYLIRFIFGSKAGVLGAFGSIMQSIFPNMMPRKLYPGPPQQFAALCGFIFTTGAMIALWAGWRGEYEITKTGQWVGGCFMVGMWGAAGLQSWVGFCLGCFFFGIGQKLGLVSTQGNLNAEQIQDEQYRTLADVDKRTNLPAPEQLVGSDGGSMGVFGEGRPSNYSYKPKNDDQRREDMDIFRHMHISFFNIPMSIMAVAAVWASARNKNTFNVGERAARGFMIVAWFFFGFFMIFYGVKLFQHTKKVVREFRHPTNRNYFSTISLTFLLGAYVVHLLDLRGEKPLWLIGSILQLIFGISAVGNWITYQQEIDLLEPSWMMPPVGCMVAGLVASTFRFNYNDISNVQLHLGHAIDGYIETGVFFYAFGFVFWMILFVSTFHRVVFGNYYVSHLRPSLSIWMAAPAIAALGYGYLTLALNSTTVASVITPVFTDIIGKSLFFFSLAMALLLAYVTLLGWWGRTRWNMGYWGYVFPNAAFALAATEYWSSTKNNAGEIIAYVSVAFTTFLLILQIGHTINAVFRRTIFVPPMKFGPLSFQKLTHYPFRMLLEQMSESVEYLNEREERLKFCRLFRIFELWHEEHSKHEDEIIFPAFNDFYPSHAQLYTATDEHERDRADLANMLKMVELLEKQGDHVKNEEEAELREKMYENVQKTVIHIGEHLVEHLDLEEQHLNWIGLQNFTIGLQKEMIRRIWNATPVALWAKLLPALIEFQPLHVRRILLIRALQWGIPERMPLIGKLLYEGLDELLFRRLSVEVPEIIPRHVAGYQRIY